MQRGDGDGTHARPSLPAAPSVRNVGQRAGCSGAGSVDDLERVGARRELGRLRRRRRRPRARPDPRVRPRRSAATTRRTRRPSRWRRSSRAPRRRPRTRPSAGGTPSRSRRGLDQTSTTNPIRAAPNSGADSAPPSTPSARANMVCERKRESARRRSVPSGRSPAAPTIVRSSPSMPCPRGRRWRSGVGERGVPGDDATGGRRCELPTGVRSGSGSSPCRTSDLPAVSSPPAYPRLAVACHQHGSRLRCVRRTDRQNAPMADELDLDELARRATARRAGMGARVLDLRRAAAHRRRVEPDLHRAGDRWTDRGRAHRPQGGAARPGAGAQPRRRPAGPPDARARRRHPACGCRPSTSRTTARRPRCRRSTP